MGGFAREGDIFTFGEFAEEFESLIMSIYQERPRDARSFFDDINVKLF